MINKSNAAVISSKHAAKEIKIYGLDTPAAAAGYKYTVDSVNRIRLELCLHEDSPRFVLDDSHLETFVTAAGVNNSEIGVCNALLNYFGEAMLFSTPCYYFCLETTKHSVLCIDNDGCKAGNCLVVQELQCKTEGDHNTWFVTPVVTYIRVIDGEIRVSPQWQDGLRGEAAEELERLGVSVNENANFIMQRVLAFLALLNTKGASDCRTVSPDAKLVAANKKRGKSTYNPYTYVRFSGVEYSGSERKGSSCAKAAHLVRGHFKRRKTGTFWWKPHIAGSGELKKRDAYIVKP